jgi:hypothetical protein
MPRALLRRLGLAVTLAALVTACAGDLAHAYTCKNRVVSLASAVGDEWPWVSAEDRTLRAVGPRGRFSMHCLPNRQFALWSLEARAWVSAELSFKGANYGMLRARASKIGPWEKFIFEPTNPKLNLTLQLGYIKSAANKRYVSVEYGYTGTSSRMLRARARPKGPWETFLLDRR